MKCPFCEFDTSVEISRPNRKMPSVWRRRYCKSCDNLFSTREKPDFSLSIQVRKNPSRIEPFSEDKLLISIYACLSHRNDALEASRALSETTLRLLLPCKTGMVETEEIKLTVLKVLKRFDKAASTYYRAHYFTS